jgi:hypothetical protein
MTEAPGTHDPYTLPPNISTPPRDDAAAWLQASR